jgi:hypothetical protein
MDLRGLKIDQIDALHLRPKSGIWHRCRIAVSNNSHFAFKKMSNGLTEQSVLRMQQSYQAVLGPEIPHEINETQKAKRILGFSAVVFFLFSCGIFLLSSSSGKANFMKASNPSELFLSGKCAPCTFIECKADLCDATLDPYQCTNGAALNGCSVKEETWSLSGVCNECCSAVDCKATVAKGNTDDEVAPCLDCTSEQCATLLLVSSQMCYKSAPYVCVEGSSRMGCSADPYHWPAMAETQCRCVTDDRTTNNTFLFHH